MSSYDLTYFLEADRVALRREPRAPWLVLCGTDVIWKFQTLLRVCEYYYSLQAPRLWQRVLRRLLHWQLEELKLKLGFTIPLYAFGPGLSIAHHGTIVVNEHARIGANCRIHVDVNIGTAAGTNNQAPTLGNNVFIGPGAKLYGKIFIANGIAVGANSVVNHDFAEPDISIGGIPARKISDKGSHGLLISATDIMEGRIHGTGRHKP